MKSSVVLKSYPEGISVILDESVTYEDILKDVALKFSEAKAFLKDASLVVSLEGRRLTSCQEKEILNVITENSQLNVLCLIGNDDENKAMFSKVRKEIEYRENENCGQFYKGSLKNGQSIETEHSIIVLGDVCENASVYSNKDIVVLGKLLGKAYAGAGGDDSHFIMALGMMPELLQIGDMTYGFSNHFDWRHRKRSQVNEPVIAYTYNGKIQLRTVTKELLDN